MLQLSENEILLRKCSGGAAQLRTVQETLQANQPSKSFKEIDFT